MDPAFCITGAHPHWLRYSHKAVPAYDDIAIIVKINELVAFYVKFTDVKFLSSITAMAIVASIGTWQDNLFLLHIIFRIKNEGLYKKPIDSFILKEWYHLCSFRMDYNIEWKV